MDWNEYQKQYQKDHYDLLTVRVPKGDKTKIKNRAKNEGKTVNAYILNCIMEHEQKIVKEGFDQVGGGQ